jgi:hypothetical protein
MRWSAAFVCAALLTAASLGAAGRGPALSLIRGNTLTANGAILPQAAVRLRDARTGRIVSAQTSDGAGLFEFDRLDPGIYVVELLGRDDSVAAASELLAVNAGDSVSAVVKLPYRPPASLTQRVVAAAAAVSSAAAVAGVLARGATGVNTSPE